MTQRLSMTKLLVLGAALALAACGSTELGSRFVKSQPVTANQAAVVTVSASDSPSLAGTKLEIPAGALAADTTLTLETAPSLVATADNAGPVAVWGPSGLTFSTPARLTMPYLLPAGKTTGQLGILVQEANGSTHRIPASSLTIDTAAGLVSFSISGFTSFQPSTSSACSADADCATGEACVAGACQVSCTPAAPSTGTCTGLSSASGCAATAAQQRANLTATACTTTNTEPLAYDCAGSWVTRETLVLDSRVCVYANGVLVGYEYQSDHGGPVVAGQWAPACATPNYLSLCAVDGGPGDAGTCISNAECASGESCVNGWCTGDVDGGPGDAGVCSSDSECGPGEACVNGWCTGDVDGGPADGGVCSSNRDCASGESCVNGWCTGDVDAGPADAGVCTTNADCVPYTEYCDATTGTCKSYALGGDGGVGVVDAGPACTNPTSEICGDGLDNDCDGVVDNGCPDLDAGVDAGMSCRFNSDCPSARCVSNICQ
jgi:hypothetical protein